MLNEFIDYLREQICMPYVWGGQHTELTPDNFVEVITKKESSEKYRQQAIEYCENLWEDGFEIAWAYDCSGLGMYWLQNLMHIYSKDMSANSMKGCCEIVEAEPKKGYWVFRCDSSGKATHIGYMVDDDHLIEAKGRAYGVCLTKYEADDWSCTGVPACFKDEIEPVDPPVPPDPPIHVTEVKVVGNSVNVRDADGTYGKVLFTAHKGNHFKLICIAPSGWYNIKTYKGDAYITNKEKYTKLVEK